MSSSLKNARWALAYHLAGRYGLDYEDFKYSGWEKLLSLAQEFFDANPEDVGYWAKKFEERGNDE